MPGMFPHYIELFGINLSQTLLTSFLSLIIFLVFVIIYNKFKSKDESNFFVSIIDMIVETMDKFFGTVSDKIPVSVKSYILFLFVYILWNNIFGLFLDVFATVLPLLHYSFRPVSTDVYFNAILALFGVIRSIVYAFSNNGFRFLEKYFNLKGVGISGGMPRYDSFLSLIKIILWFGVKFVDMVLGLFIGLLELVGEFTKILSLTLRLFGNIFAGVVLIGLVTAASVAVFKVPFLFPIAVIAMELLVGLLQAFIFALLVLVYFKMAEESH